MIELKVEISDVDYADIMEKVLPEIMPRLAKNQSELVKKVLVGLAGKGEIARKALKFLPESLQDEIAVALLSSYKSNILEAVHKLADEQNISITVSDITVELKDNK
jgi:hypothetical protein